MKIAGDRHSLLKAIQTVENVVSEKSLLPILSNVVIETTNGGIQLLATDLKTSISHKMNLEVLQQGAVTLPAKKLADIIREMPDGRVELVVEEGYKAKIFSGRTRYQILGFSKEDFPKLPSLLKGESITLPAKTLKRAIHSVAFAAAQDDTRFVLNGCLITVTPTFVRFVATDGHRLSWMVVPITSQGSWQAIIPTKTLKELGSVLGEDDTPVSILYGENKIECTLQQTKLVASVVEGQFPNVEEVLKRPYQLKVALPTESLLRAIKRASLVALDKSNTVTFHFQKGLMVLTAQTPELGEAREELEVPYEGQEVSIALNYRYVLDALKIINTERLTLAFNDGASAVCLIPDSAEEAHHVVMPIRSS